MSARAAEEAGRQPSEIKRSACLLVVLDRAAGERQVNDGVRPLEGPMESIAASLQEMAEAGADEAILVLSPITEASVTALTEVLRILDA